MKKPMSRSGSGQGAFKARLFISAMSVLLLLQAVSSGAPTPLFLDTDFGPDCDDAGAVSILHRFCDAGEISIIGMTICTSDQWAAPALDAVNTYYGRPDIPIGTLKETGFLSGPYWTKDIAAGFPNTIKNGSNAPDATVLTRQILAAQTNGSVTFVSIGPLNNLKKLLQSGADKYSSLSGRDLVAQKCSKLVCMAFCENQGGSEWNAKQDSSASQYVIANWPTHIYLSGAYMGGGVSTGFGFSTRTPVTCPVRKAYELYTGGPSKGNGSWDPIACYYAAHGFGIALELDRNGPGNVNVAADGSNTYSYVSTGKTTWLRNIKGSGDDTDLVKMLEEAMMTAKAGGGTAVLPAVARGAQIRSFSYNGVNQRVDIGSPITMCNLLGRTFSIVPVATNLTGIVLNGRNAGNASVSAGRYFARAK